MLKIYKCNGLTFQYEEGEQPKDAVEVKSAAETKPAADTKAVTPSNKARTVKNK